MEIEDLINLLKKKGFSDTFQVLLEFKNYKAEKHEFYNELNKFSYYNSFFRVKESLVQKGLIRINKYKGKNYNEVKTLETNFIENLFVYN